jgi:peroxiredoxin Q/BCP
MTSPKETSVLLRPGDPAPDFTARAYPLGLISLNRFRGRKNVILAFYPLDFYPGATIEMRLFSDNLDRFEAIDTQVLGVSCDSLVSHAKFASGHGFKVPLVADEDGSIGTSYGALRGGRNRPERVLFFINERGVIEYVFAGMPEIAGLLSHLGQVVSRLKMP